MNMHCPQNILAETELRHLPAIPYQIISPSSNSPIIGIYQDSLLGSFQFTRPNIQFTPREAMNLLMMFPNVDTKAIRDSGKNVTSYQILSQILKPITLSYKTKLYADNPIPNNILEIRNGQWISGQIEKAVMGSTTKGILHRIFNDFGPMACANFIDDIQNVITEYMKTSSFSVGISDLIANKTTMDAIIQALNKQKIEVQSLIEKVHLGIFENNTAGSNMVEFEMQVNKLLNKATEESGSIGRKSLSKDNRFLMIVNSGSKGSLINISQMISGLGQQNVDGKRIPYGFDSRTLPHYFKYDDGPSARGFVDNSYISGLTAPELFFHAMGGRIGLIDTAIKTSSSGYIQRRLIKGLEDIKVEYDMTVRNSKGKIVQFSYGEDGFDTTRIENQIIPLVGMSIEDIYLHYDILGLNESSEKDMLSVYAKATATRVKRQVKETKVFCQKYITKMIKNRDEIVDAVFGHKNDNMVKMPVAFQNIIANIQGQLHLNANSIVDITPLECFQMIESYYNKLKNLEFSAPNHLFEVLYYYYLSPKDLIVNKRFHTKALTVLLETIVLKYKQAIVHPGEMVGIIAGHSCGEPVTQLTLNTFHLAGSSSKSNVTRGVPRIEEILRLTRNPKNPSLTVHMKTIDEQDRDRAVDYANMMEYTKLVDMVKSIQISFDPNEHASFIEEDRVLIEQFYEFENVMRECMNEDVTDETEKNAKKSKWIIRMEIDPEALLDKNITMDDIHYAIKNSTYGEAIDCVFSDFNEDKLIFRIRITNEDVKKKKVVGVANALDQSDEIFQLKNFQDALLQNIVLRGVNHIEKVIPRKLKNMVVLEDGKYIRKDTWVLDTTGSNMLSVLGLDYIDYKRTFSNDIREVFDVLGIEAARQTIYNEFFDVMEFSDAYINFHHLSLLCDRMTMTKDLVPIFRSGILNDDIGPIAKATFEVHTEVLLDAARHADFDHMRGVSSSVMCGQYGNYGTGAFSLVLDINQMRNLSDANVVADDADIDGQFGIAQDRMDTCAKKDLEIQNNIINIQIPTTANVCDDEYNMGF
jgi:DNA-directed RNA polymerase II subunit RPB1